MAAHSEMARRLLCLVALGVLAVLGCSSGPMPVHIQGQVTFDGQPLSDGTVIFMPVDGTGGPSTGGSVTGGHFDVPAEKGPLSGGTYKVEVTALRKNGKRVPNMFDSSGKPAELSEQYVPAAYNTKSVLKLTIPEGSHSVELDIPLVKAGSAVQLTPH